MCGVVLIRPLCLELLFNLQKILADQSFSQHARIRGNSAKQAFPPSCDYLRELFREKGRKSWFNLLSPRIGGVEDVDRGKVYPDWNNTKTPVCFGSCAQKSLTRLRGDGASFPLGPGPGGWSCQGEWQVGGARLAHSPTLESAEVMHHQWQTLNQMALRN